MSEADIAELTNGLENLQIETSSNVTLDVGVENAEETTANQDINNSKSVDLKTETPEESETESDDESEVDSEASEDRESPKRGFSI
ncbi:hypothetical protein HK098_005522 [Nowakowskiella sp. JEL0407]|nr:hypothetical protein HK098_005522 [Nowakowskiella sp. JEL0407]